VGVRKVQACGSRNQKRKRIGPTITHTLTWENGTKRPKASWEEAESRAAPVIRKLANPQYELTQENLSHLIVFISFMFARVPSWREYLNKLMEGVFKQSQVKLARDTAKFDAMCEKFEQATGKPLGMSREKLRNYILEGKYELRQTSEAFNLGSMFQSGLGIMEQLMHFGCEVLYAPQGKFFVTSDSPVYTVLPDKKGQATVGVGFGWPGVEVFFPLNKKACLRMKRDLTPRSAVLAESGFEKIEGLVMATAARYLYSSESYKRIGRLFDERGCKVLAGRDAFLPRRPKEHAILF
jgi:hypothetical protein